jgi:hypothetical protein
VGYQQQDAPALGVFAGVRQLINAGRPNLAPNIVDAGGNDAAKTSLIVSLWSCRSPQKNTVQL